MKLLKRGGSGAGIVEAAILLRNFKKLLFQRVVAVSFGMLVVCTWFPSGFQVVSKWLVRGFLMVSR
jgi:hypothetical protein